MPAFEGKAENMLALSSSQFDPNATLIFHSERQANSRPALPFGPIRDDSIRVVEPWG
jgi:hypothetical protein